MRTLNYKKMILQFVRLMFGLLLCSIGILFTIHSQLGASPWDTFHVGLTNYVHLTLGQVTQLIGAIVIAFDVAMKEIPGPGTILNMFSIGFFLDLIESLAIIPNPGGLVSKLLMLLAGTVITGWGTFFYIGAGWGAGPRDSLMLGLSKRLSAKVWQIRMAIEVFVVVAGFLLGAKIGLGTILVALSIGPVIQIIYRICQADPKTVHHTTLLDVYNYTARLVTKSLPVDKTIEMGDEHGR